jgi:hypothetical protein
LNQQFLIEIRNFQVSRIEAAARALVSFYWSRKQTKVLTRPIYSQSTNKIIGYFDRISVKRGQMQLDGWVTAKTLRVETDAGSLDIYPDLERPDVPGPGTNPGFSVALRGSRSLQYCVGPNQPFSRVQLVGCCSAATNVISYLMCLADFAVHNYKDIWTYFVHGDPLAGDRLEFNLLANSGAGTLPMAARNLFAPHPVPKVENRIDIIVPVYNAYSETLRCLRRLATHTDTHHRVILVHDASTDPAFTDKRISVKQDNMSCG